jgi:hypothetical protein
MPLRRAAACTVGLMAEHRVQEECSQQRSRLENTFTSNMNRRFHSRLGVKKQGVREVWRKLHKEELLNQYFCLFRDNIQGVKSERMTYVGRVTLMR